MIGVARPMAIASAPSGLKPTSWSEIVWDISPNALSNVPLKSPKPSHADNGYSIATKSRKRNRLNWFDIFVTKCLIFNSSQYTTNKSYLLLVNSKHILQYCFKYKLVTDSIVVLRATVFLALLCTLMTATVSARAGEEGQRCDCDIAGWGDLHGCHRPGLAGINRQARYPAYLAHPFAITRTRYLPKIS